MKWLKYILVALCAVCVTDTYSAVPTWEYLSAYKPMHETDESEKIEITVRDGYIYISTPVEVTVKVMSIVGQLISQQHVKPGVSRLKMSARGIYILKAGSVTTRVTV